jgi:NADH-quinone oxidoreductase subunit A
MGVEDLDISSEFIVGLAPFLFYFSLVLLVVVTMLGLSYFLGQKTSRHYTNMPFESGIVSTGSAQFRISVHFYLPAILFIIFDLEVVFLFAWAVAVKQAGWPGFIEISVFIGILLAALFYLWRIGALDWRTQTQKRELKTMVGPGGVTNLKEFSL